ncbi:MAG: putative quinol monooxygenase [Nostocoides sp.]
MAELDVVAVIRAQAGHEDSVRSALQALATATRQEEGCMSYDLKVASDQPTVFVTVERWRGAEDLAAHMQAPHLLAALESAGPYLAAPPAIYPLADA